MTATNLEVSKTLTDLKVSKMALALRVSKAGAQAEYHFLPTHLGLKNNNGCHPEHGEAPQTGRVLPRSTMVVTLWTDSGMLPNPVSQIVPTGQ
jgi:hypothetical protein